MKNEKGDKISCFSLTGKTNFDKIIICQHFGYFMLGGNLLAKFQEK